MSSETVLLRAKRNGGTGQSAGSLGQGGHVFGPLDLEAILVVDGGEVFEQLGGSQYVRCHKHKDLSIEIVNRECLRKHETVCHAERELQSKL